MAKHTIVSIGYQEYMIPSHHIQALLEAAKESIAVERKDYRSPLRVKEDQKDCWFTLIKVEEVEEDLLPSEEALAPIQDEIPF